MTFDSVYIAYQNGLFWSNLKIFLQQYQINHYHNCPIVFQNYMF